ncbi:hypothetical protein A3D81_01710 [Candidatus Curtissbacteria bacterium RIFCSPHIGHO2_02_FULL_40_17]|uniref:Uncharacterized protein n=3 Tax=Candidatus Curtissiibacteriota TaxID=1752717 RepID=A0A1F5GG54_9BACT|nr:MAG: hypothetical protein A2693_04310 [Candidatus Curtissbacteria bacterium RIFCSPHIGHO2_01_FULL_40_12]OGD90835.1 MAG: hypothetical protein A3D81_01710 [Candidatus Curtissbacteria bacterium RIFCSPHIGHO2_02_FULL_40_17]OGE05068.1 MAG: hypothetical protein A3F45_02550 [Candidatus Curtissbacteria bacterium RIFCSPHIGHO2_12_FULL_41_17]
MSPECDFFSGSNGVRCHRVRALSVIKEHLGLNVEELKELLPVLCQEEGDSERIIDCPAFAQLITGDNSDFAIRQRL